MAAAKYLKQLHEIATQAGNEEPSLNVKMVGYQARMKLGNRKWVGNIQPTTSKAIADVAKQAIIDLQVAADIVRQNHVSSDDTVEHKHAIQ